MIVTAEVYTLAANKSVQSLRAQLKKIQDELVVAERDEAIRRLASSKEFKAVAKTIRTLGLTSAQIIRLFSEKPASKTVKRVEPKYRHPDDPKLLWSGRGRQPKWVAELVSSGTELESLAIRDK